MIIKKTIIFFIVLGLVTSSLYSVSAEGNSKINELKKGILFKQNLYSETYKYDTNNDNQINVFDFCRMKKSILFSVPQNLDIELSGFQIKGDYSGLTIPVKISGNNKGISSIQFRIQYDDTVFSLENAYSTDGRLSCTYSSNNKMVQCSSVYGDNLNFSYDVIFLEFRAADYVADAVYDFSLLDINAAYINDYGTQQEYTENECSKVSDVLKVAYGRNNNPVTTVVTTLEPEQIVTTLHESMDETQGIQYFVNELNKYRSSNNLGLISLESNGCAAANERARLLSESYQENLPNGADFITLLYDYKIYPFRISQYIDNQSSTWETAFDRYMSYSKAIVDNNAYKRIGIGHYIDNGRDYWAVFTY